LLVGNGRDADALRHRVDSSHRVLWIDRYVFDRTQLWSYLSAADVYAIPSRYEGFAVAVLEAMACGLPVVVSDQVDLCIEVHDAQAGLVVTCDTGELATALGRMLDDAALRERCGANGRRLVAEQFRWDRVAGRLHNLYESARRGRVESG